MKTSFMQLFSLFLFNVAVDSVDCASWRGMCQFKAPASLQKYQKH